MWPKPSVPSFLLLALLAASPSFYAPSAQAAPPSTGPTSAEDLAVLQRKVPELYASEDFDELLTPLLRWVERYPGQPDAATYRKMTAWLGHAYLETGHPKKALPYLRKYLDGQASERPLQPEVKLWLIESYLEMKEYHQAYLLTEEPLLMGEKTADAPLEAQKLLLRSHALIGLKQDDRAAAVLDEMEKLGQTGPAATSQAAALRVELKTRTCEKLPSAKKLDEAQALDQFRRRGVCLSEALPLYRTAIEKASSDLAAEHALKLMAGATTSYMKACSQVPEPPRARARKMNARQKKEYRKELASRLGDECRSQLDFSQSILDQWIGTLNAPAESKLKAQLQLFKTKLVQTELHSVTQKDTKDRS